MTTPHNTHNLTNGEQMTMKTDTTRRTTKAVAMGKRYPVVVTQSAESHIIREVYEDCDLHKALMNVGYEIYRKDYYIAGKYTGKKVDYYAPAIDYTTWQGSESPSATLWRLQDLALNSAYRFCI